MLLIDFLKLYRIYTWHNFHLNHHLLSNFLDRILLVLRAAFRKAFLETVAYGAPSSSAYQRAVKKLCPSGSRSPRLISAPCVHPSSIPEISIDDGYRLSSKAETQEIPQTPKTQKPERLHSKKNTKVTINPMEQDLSKHKRNRLHVLIKQYQDDYLTSLLDADCNEASTAALKKERNAFYEVFGAKPSEQEALAKLIAKDLDSHSNDSAKIVNGLINYLKNLANFLQSRKIQLEQKAPNLLRKYIKYGVHEVYRLIKSISHKVTTAGHSKIDPYGNLFPQVHKSISDIFGQAMQPIEF